MAVIEVNRFTPSVVISSVTGPVAGCEEARKNGAVQDGGNQALVERCRGKRFSLRSFASLSRYDSPSMTMTSASCKTRSVPANAS
jgi:hypothetical protein